MKPPDDDDPSVNDEPAPALVELSPAHFEAMLGSYNDLALHVVLGDDDDHHGVGSTRRQGPSAGPSRRSPSISQARAGP